MKRLARILAVAALVIVALVLAGALIVQTPRVRDYLRGVAERQAERFTGTEVDIGALTGNLFTGAVLHDVRVTGSGRPIFRAPRVAVDYSLVDLLTGELDINGIAIRQPVIHLRRTAEGPLNLAALGRPQAQPVSPRAPAGPRRGWAIDALAIDGGTLVIHDGVVATEAVNAPERLVDLDGAVGLRAPASETGVRLDIERLSFRAERPALAVTGLQGELFFSAETIRFEDLRVATRAGTIALDGSIRNRQDTPVYDLDLELGTLELPQLAPMIPALGGISLSPSATASAKGSLQDLAIQFVAETQAGGISGDVRLDATPPERAIEGELRTTGLNLAAFQLGETAPTDLTLTANVDFRLPEAGLSGLQGRYRVEAPALEYASYAVRHVQASGTIDGRRIGVDGTAAVYGGHADVDGSVTLPSGGAPIQYDLDTRLRGIDPARLPDAVRPPGAVDATLRIRGRGREVDVEGEVADLTLAGADFGARTTIEVSRRGGRVSYAAAGTVSGLNLRRLGRELGFDGLTGERFESDIDASFDVTGGGVSLGQLTLRGTATLTDSALLGARFSTLTVKPDLTRGSGTAAIAGSFAGVDIAEMAGPAGLASDLQGTVDARITLEDLGNPDFSLGALEAGGRLTLRDSTIAGVPIERATIAADLGEATLSLRQVSVSGPDMDVRLDGTLALDAGRPSRLQYYVNMPALQRFGALGVPVRGDVRLQGVVTGRLQQLHVEGTLSGSHLGYGGTTVMSANSQYAVDVPNLEWANASVVASADLAELEAAGREFTSLVAKIDYAARQLAFDGAVRHAEHLVETQGRVVWHADHREVHLRRFRLETPQTAWTLTGGGEAAIRYGGDGLAISGLTLVTGAGGRIEVDGGLGASGQSLRVAVAGLQLDHVDEFFLEEPLAGVVDASAVVRGPLTEPTIDAKLAITDGSYRTVSYERLSGEVAFRPSVVRLDARLDQSAGVALTAKGTVPLSDAAGDALDLAVASTPVDLAIVQAFTDEVEDVRGRMELDLRVSGSLDAPRLEGSLAVHDGAFTVALAQSHYTGLDTEIAFESDVVRVREFRLQDDEGNSLAIGGQLQLAGRTVRVVNIWVRAADFELADNRFGELTADTDVRITGAVLRPRIAGTITLGEGFLRIDRLLDALQGPYELPATEPGTRSDDAAAAQRPEFAPVVDLQVQIAERFNVRGSDLRAAGGVPIGLGDVNITIGGDIAIRKNPGEDVIVRGEVRTVRGTYEFQGRQFEIARDGRVVLMGTEEINPRLDITATRDISGVTATVHIGGVLREPELRLSSSPPMDDAEVLSLIVFNQPLSLLGTGEQVSLATRAAALASGFVASRLTESIGEALELDVLEVQTAASPGAGLTLTLGEQFGRLFLRLQQRFGPEAVSRAVLEYRFAEWLRVQSAFAQGSVDTRQLLERVEVGGIDLVFRFSY